MSIYAIGDVQGCYDPLRRLLDKIKFDPSQDQLWFAGDLVNRGPDSLKTLIFISELGEQARCVLGNHDLHLLAVAAGVQTPNPKDTLGDILQSSRKEELMHWLAKQPLLIYEPSINYALCHAGIYPLWNLQQAQQYALEIEQILQDPQKRNQLLQAMYHEGLQSWHQDHTNIQRWRFILDAFTRMRYLTPKAELILKEKALSNNPEHTAWFAWPKHKSLETTNLLFGHWAALEGKTNHKNAIALDTGCVWGGTLTAFNLSTKTSICVSA